MGKRKVAVVITARPSYSRVRTAIRAIDRHPKLELLLIVAASALIERYGNTARLIESDGFKIHARAFTLVEGEDLLSMAKTTGLGIIELSGIFQNLQPDVVVTVADRYETISTAITASYMNLPLVHIQGGEVTGSIDEKVRHSISKMADLHLVATEGARERLIRMGEEERSVFVTGCPSIDIAREAVEESSSSISFFDEYLGVGPSLDLSAGYFVVLQHPVTTYHAEARMQVEETLYAMKDVGLPVLWFWPNSDAGSDGTSKGIRVFRERENPSNFHFFKNMRPKDFLQLLIGCVAVVGNSSVGIRECAFLGVPAINIGERQKGRERGSNVYDVGHDRAEIRELAISLVGQQRKSTLGSDLLYGDGRSGERIASHIAAWRGTFEKRIAY